jgi:aminoglycoside phosphotransferase (APT) family kinase protein
VRVTRLSDINGQGPVVWQLGLNDVPEFLLSRELVDPRAIVDNDLIVRNFSSGRHYVFSAESSDGASYLLKQNPYIDPKTAAREAAVYESLSCMPAIRKFIPRFHGYDTDRHVLVLEFIPTAVDLATYHHNLRRPPIGVATAIGANLAELHCISTGQSQSEGTEPRPSALTLHRPHVRMARDCSPACLNLIRILQNTDGYGPCLDELNRSWAATALIHRDIRLKNFLLTAPVRTMRHADLKLIDWELACVGDPRWDIGSALGNYLSLWLESIPTTAMADLARATALARRPLSSIQPAIRACWKTYSTRRGLASEAAERMLVGTVGFAAARLVQTAYEAAQGSIMLTTTGVLHLQLAFNMLARPEETVAHLYGLTLAHAFPTSVTGTVSRDH